MFAAQSDLFLFHNELSIFKALLEKLVEKTKPMQHNFFLPVLTKGCGGSLHFTELEVQNSNKGQRLQNRT